MSREQAESLVLRYPVAFISITDVGKDRARLPEHRFVRGVLRLSFDDFTTPEDGFIVFDESFATQIVDFFEEHRDEVKAFLIHCEMGISRSAGLANALAEIYEVPVSHNNRSDIWPNRLVRRTMLELASKRMPARAEAWAPIIADLMDRV